MVSPFGLPDFGYRGGELHCEDVRMSDLAERFGTPLYVYSASAMRRRYQRLQAAFGDDARICYAVKANSNLSVLRLFAALGSGFDLVSGGELERLVAAGVDPSRAVFAGSVKQEWEIDRGVELGVAAFQVESPHEIELLVRSAKRHSRVVPVALRLNPDVHADTHAYITTAREDSKFGLSMAEAGEVVRRIAGESCLRLVGYHVHLGSQLHDIRPYLEALDRVAEFMQVEACRHDGVEHYDMGGGFGIGYGERSELQVEDLAAAVMPRLESMGLRLMMEPGRFLVGDAGALLTTVVGQKQAGTTHFLLVDAAMTELIRPALYQAHHPIVAVREPVGAGEVTVDVVGPVCESGDFLARGRVLPRVDTGDRLAVLAAGAYGASMASNYNTRPRAAEVLVDGGEARLVRRRETHDRLWADEIDCEGSLG
jgi:diaminopimelate decarboxylase